MLCFLANLALFPRSTCGERFRNPLALLPPSPASSLPHPCPPGIELVLHIRSVFRRSLRTVVIPWCVIPGYSSLLQALLFEMKQRYVDTRRAVDR